MKQVVLTCTCCGAKTACEHGTVGDMEVRSGYMFVFLIDGGSTWLCPACWKLALPHLHALIKTFGKLAEDVHYRGLIIEAMKETT